MSVTQPCAVHQPRTNTESHSEPLVWKSSELPLRYLVVDAFDSQRILQFHGAFERSFEIIL